MSFLTQTTDTQSQNKTYFWFNFTDKAENELIYEAFIAPSDDDYLAVMVPSNKDPKLTEARHVYIVERHVQPLYKQVMLKISTVS